jgi:hypothetical protein
VALRRIAFLVLAGDLDAADAAITTLFDEVRRTDDSELGRHVSSQLAAVAAGCFLRKKPADANALLVRCEEIHPESAADHPYPARVELPFTALPRAGQEWLSRQKPGGVTLRRSVWGAAAFVFLITLGVQCAVFSTFFDDPRPWSAPAAAGALALIAAFVATLSVTGSDIRRTLAGPLRAFVTLHPLYIVEASVDRILVHPLLRLDRVDATHHHTNGGYTHTAITLWFGGHAVYVTLRRKQYAEEWAGAILRARNRVMQLMLEGYLEAEQGLDLIPPALLTRAPGPARRFGPRFYAATAAAAVALWGIVTFLHQRAGEDELWAAALRAGTIEALAPHAASGRHAAAVREEMARLHQRAHASLGQAQDPGAPGAQALHGMLAALEVARTREVPVTVTVGGASDPELSRGLVADLGRVLTRVGLAPVIELTADRAAGATTPPVLDGGSAGSADSAGSAPIPPVTLSVTADPGSRTGPPSCAAVVNVGGTATPSFTWSVPVASDGSPVPARPLIAACTRELAGAFGLAGVARAVDLRAPRPLPSSPYAAKR